ncbi:hypothetical protein A2U01_0053975, partial [Trifolium medium]|nr:hypothetical protein [Trifolium medium]
PTAPTPISHCWTPFNCNTPPAQSQPPSSPNRRIATVEFVNPCGGGIIGKFAVLFLGN